ncbi:hypothetical protein AAHH78_41165, partial [Burkholderia pseudomallei]
HRIVVSAQVDVANATWLAIRGGDIDPSEPLFEAADRFSAAERLAAYAVLLLAQLRRHGLAAAVQRPAQVTQSLVERLA